MANFYWVGGYTGGTGENTGFQSTGASGGTFGGPVWKNLTPHSNPALSWCNFDCCDSTSPSCTGLTGYGWTSTVGDLWFSPYYWGNTQNWRINIGDGQYVKPNVLPQGGDAVIFKGPSLRNPNGTPVSPYNYSCLWGGMSGDAHTASGSTAWIRVAGQTATNQFGHIPMTVESDWKAGVTPTSAIWPGTTHSISQGNIGYGGNTFGMWTQTIPLNIRTLDLAISSASLQLLPLNRDLYQQVYACVNNIEAANKFSYLRIQRGEITLIGHVHRGLLMAKGHWGQITQNNCGLIYLHDIENSGKPFTDSKYTTLGSVISSNVSNNCQIASFDLKSPSLKPSYIWGCTGDTAVVNIAPTTTPQFGSGHTFDIVLGRIYSICNGCSCQADMSETPDGPQFTEVSITSLSSLRPRVLLGSCNIDLLTAKGKVEIRPHENLTPNDNVIIRDGSLADGVTLNMSIPNNPFWQNFILGHSSTDNGIRVDDETVRILGYSGQTFKTGFPEDTSGNTGSTGY